MVILFKVIQLKWEFVFFEMLVHYRYVFNYSFYKSMKFYVLDGVIFQTIGFLTVRKRNPTAAFFMDASVLCVEKEEKIILLFLVVDIFSREKRKSDFSLNYEK